MVKNLPANAGDIRDADSIPGLGSPLEGGTATHSSILAWRLPWMGEIGKLHTVHGVPQSQTQLRDFTYSRKCSRISGDGFTTL